MNANTDAAPAGDILVVDDTVANLKLLANILTEAGYRVRPTSDGELALRSVQAKQPALILLDIRMPGVDGFEVCRRLKADERTRDIPVIFLSSLTDTADRTKGFELGAVDYIDKPYHAQEVLARIKTHLALSAAREQLRIQNLQLQQANEQLTREVAERKRAEEALEAALTRTQELNQALRESRDRLDEIYRSVGEGIVSVDEEQRVVLFNSAAERLFGHPAAAMIGRSLSVLLPERFRASHEQHVRAFGATGQSNRSIGTYGQICGVRASGEEFPIEATVSQSGVSPNRLFTVILRDITERRQAEQVREQLMRQLEALSARLATAQEEESRRIAYELHEELGQQLMALKFYLQMAGSGAGGAQTDTPQDQALAVTAHATTLIRKLVMDLAPPELEDFGLDAALHAYCERQAAAGGWKLHIDATKPDVRAPRQVEKACFRVLQEGLRNVLHHAKATEVWVHLHQSADELELGIRDNGNGFDCNAGHEGNGSEPGNLGLFGMQIRAKHVGGSVEIKSTTGAGTEIRAVFPLLVASAGPI
ncbi:MAG: response regulator [Betaproteobacteria bacterium]|nr:response regulator [Betaproteobacteria bacterium]